MLWEKRDLKDPEKRGYLYIRESIYVRDKRSHIRKPKKLGSGKAKKERGKYTKKKDIYCGKIVECRIKDYKTFEEYITNIHKEFLEYKLNHGFSEIIDDFTKYLIQIYDLEEDALTKKPKKSYEVSSGYLSEKTIEHVKNFVYRKGAKSKKEIERFAYRCEDAGIFDEEIIHLLFTKISQTDVSEDVKEDIKKLKQHKLQSQEFENFRDYMRKEHRENN